MNNNQNAQNNQNFNNSLSLQQLSQPKIIPTQKGFKASYNIKITLKTQIPQIDNPQDEIFKYFKDFNLMRFIKSQIKNKLERQMRKSSKTRSKSKDRRRSPIFSSQPESKNQQQPSS